jgi:glycosyltransferase involved in cell wall biosynthesis
MDVLVHPSRREGLARALPQGSLAGCPVVTYDVDGNREALVDGETGFLLPAFDREKLASALRVLMGDPSLRRSMGDAGRRFALARFDAKVMVDALERVYQDALASMKQT